MYKLETLPGDYFASVAEIAKLISHQRNEIVEFDFNEVNCIVNSETDLDLIYRDYSNAHLMGWETVGPDCKEYDEETQRELEKRTAEREAKAKIEQEKYEKEEAEKKQSLEEKIEGIEMEFSNKELWDEGLRNNQDGYGRAIYTYAELWARLMQYEMQKFQNSVKDVAEKASYEADVEGITGFMYGAAVSVLASTWKHGEELRKWHNKDYGHEGDGVVNPAVLTIGKKE